MYRSMSLFSGRSIGRIDPFSLNEEQNQHGKMPVLHHHHHHHNNNYNNNIKSSN